MTYENKVVKSIKLLNKHPYQPNLYDELCIVFKDGEVMVVTAYSNYVDVNLIEPTEEL